MRVLARPVRAVALLLVAWLALLVPPCDADAYHYLRVGEFVRDHGLPVTDPFSEFGQGKPYVAYAWPFALAFRLVFGACGWQGVLLAKASLCALVGALLLRFIEAREERLPAVAGLFAVSILGLLGNFSPRPWLITIAFFVALVDLLLRARATGRAGPLWALPVIFAAWACTHIQFVLGLLVVFLALAEALFESWVRRRPPALGWRPLAVALGASALATLATPYHVHIWEVVLEYGSGVGVSGSIGEFNAPSFRWAQDWANLGLLAAGAFALGWRREARPFPYLLLGTGAVLAFRASRDGWFLDIAGLAAVLPSSPLATRRASAAELAVAGVLGVAGAALVGLPRVREANLLAAERRQYPVAAVRAIEERGVEGPLYNPYMWGNYLTWALPRIPVQIDGRTNLHGNDRIARSLRTWGGYPGWADDPELARARCVIAARGYPLADLLRAEPRFAIVFEDDIAVVFSARR